MINNIQIYRSEFYYLILTLLMNWKINYLKCAKTWSYYEVKIKSRWYVSEKKDISQIIISRKNEDGKELEKKLVNKNKELLIRS